jgi:hypothetical protein
LIPLAVIYIIGRSVVGSHPGCLDAATIPDIGYSSVFAVISVAVLFRINVPFDPFKIEVPNQL